MPQDHRLSLGREKEGERVPHRWAFQHRDHARLEKARGPWSEERHPGPQCSHRPHDTPCRAACSLKCESFVTGPALPLCGLTPSRRPGPDAGSGSTRCPSKGTRTRKLENLSFRNMSSEHPGRQHSIARVTSAHGALNPLLLPSPCLLPMSPGLSQPYSVPHVPSGSAP